MSVSAVRPYDSVKDNAFIVLPFIASNFLFLCLIDGSSIAFPLFRVHASRSNSQENQKVCTEKPRALYNSVGVGAVIIFNKLIFINDFTPFLILVFVSCPECEYSNEEGNGGSNGVVQGAAAVSAWPR